MGPGRPGKRVRADESFFDQGNNENSGSYLKVKLLSGKALKSRGWPWVQLGIRGVLGDVEKLEKATFLTDGSLLIKTKHALQTEKFLKARKFANEDCEVLKDEKLNTSRGTIRAYDLEELSEDEVILWLKDFGVVGAKRFTRKVNGQTQGTPTLLLTFDRPSCPTKLQMDYVTYHVHTYVPNPLLCYRCGKFGHAQERCTRDKVCLNCGQTPHEGECMPRCISCQSTDHGCQSHDCETWQKEKEICRIKVEEEVSFSQARKLYDDHHEPPVLRNYAGTVRTPHITGRQEDEELKGKVEKLEKKVDEMVTLLKTLMETQITGNASKGDASTTDAVGVQKTQSAVVQRPRGDETMGGVTSDRDEGEMNDVGKTHETTQPMERDEEDEVNRTHDMTQTTDTVTKNTGSARWQSVQRRKGLGKEKGKTKPQTSASPDAIPPAPPLVRGGKSCERAGDKPMTRKQSWVDLSQVASDN